MSAPWTLISHLNLILRLFWEANESRCGRIEFDRGHGRGLGLGAARKKGQGRLGYSGRPLRPQLQNLIHFHFGFV